MKQEHLVAAYRLAVSEVPTEQLFEDQTFRTVFPDISFSRSELEIIGSEATCLRGDESYDWLTIGAQVYFQSNLRTGEILSGVVSSINFEIDAGTQRATILVGESPTRQHRVNIHSIYHPRDHAAIAARLARVSRARF
jgi:hypothetical protein